MTYDLRDEELKTLTNNSVKQVPIDKRLEILNGVIKDDFADKITFDMLNSKEHIAIGLKPEILEEMNARLHPAEVVAINDEMSIQRDSLERNAAVVDGRELQENKGWFREGAHGREVEVGEIRVEPAEEKGKFKMTAVINGENISHEITQKQYDKFMAVDDYHRMKLFSKVFHEVDMKGRSDGVALGTKIGAALLAGVTVMSELSRGFDRPGPEFYMEHHHSRGSEVRPYFKPGVDSPMDVASRNFEAAANTDMMRNELHHGM